jgi:hypothetical protein
MYQYNFNHIYFNQYNFYHIYFNQYNFYHNIKEINY